MASAGALNVKLVAGTGVDYWLPAGERDLRVVDDDEAVRAVDRCVRHRQSGAAFESECIAPAAMVATVVEEPARWNRIATAEIDGERIVVARTLDGQRFQRTCGEGLGAYALDVYVHAVDVPHEPEAIWHAVRRTVSTRAVGIDSNVEGRGQP